MEIWRGKSVLDGNDIVVLATANSKNAKTGDMIQISIMRADMHPVTAQHTGDDFSICGSCNFRPSLTRIDRAAGEDMSSRDNCYVAVHQGPAATWRAWKNGRHADPKHVAEISDKLYNTPLRFGTYGDPGVVPLKVWHKLLEKSTGKFCGYSHLWRHSKFAKYKQFLMASCDSVEEAQEAQAKGWRTFTAIPVEDVALNKLPKNSIACLYDTRGLQCVDCGLCDGLHFNGDLESDNRKSIWIPMHGKIQQGHKRKLRVL